jgi:hypothetical protein
MHSHQYGTACSQPNIFLNHNWTFLTGKLRIVDIMPSNDDFYIAGDIYVVFNKQPPPGNLKDNASQ